MYQELQVTFFLCAGPPPKPTVQSQVQSQVNRFFWDEPDSKYLIDHYQVLINTTNKNSVNTTTMNIFETGVDVTITENATVLVIVNTVDQFMRNSEASTPVSRTFKGS